MKDREPDTDDRIRIDPVSLIWISIYREQELKRRRADLFTYEIRSKICHMIKGN